MMTHGGITTHNEQGCPCAEFGGCADEGGCCGCCVRCSSCGAGIGRSCRGSNGRIHWRRNASADAASLT